MDPSTLPPCSNPSRLKQLLYRVRDDDREDAIQEAWLAHLSGDCPIRAVDRFRKQEAAARSHGEIRNGRNGVWAYDGREDYTIDGTDPIDRKRATSGAWEEGNRDDT